MNIVTLLLGWRLWDSIGRISFPFHNTSVLTQSHGESCVPLIIGRRGTLEKLLSLLQSSFFLLSLRQRPKVTHFHELSRSEHIDQYADSLLRCWVRVQESDLRTKTLIVQ